MAATMLSPEPTPGPHACRHRNPGDIVILVGGHHQRALRAQRHHDDLTDVVTDQVPGGRDLRGTIG